VRRLTLCALALLLPLLPLHAQDAKGKILYSRKTGDQYRLHAMNPDGTDSKELPGQTENVNLFPALSPDGKRIAFMAGPSQQFKEFKLYVMDADGKNVRAIETNSKIAGLPAWSPDGKQLAYVAGDDRPSVFVADVLGNGARQLSPEGTGGIFPFWHPDGKKVGYTRLKLEERRGDLVFTSADGSSTETVIESDKVVFGGAHSVSPDGKRLVLQRADPANKTASLCVYDLANKGETTLAEVQVAERDGPDQFPVASWAADGKSILASLPSDKGFGIFLLSEDGQKKQRLTPEGVDCFTPVWQPAR
jgi:TolB protein